MLSGDMTSGWLWWIVLTSPIYLGAIIGVVKPRSVICYVHDVSDWLDTRYGESAARGGLGDWTLRRTPWGVHLLHRATSRIPGSADRAGIKAMLFFYVTVLTFLIAYVAVIVVFWIAVIVVGLMVLGFVLGKATGESSSSSPASLRPTRERERPASRPEPTPRRDRHPAHILNRESEHCACRHGCAPRAVLTEWDCGCRLVDLRDEQPAGPDCTNFSGRRRYCGASGRPFVAEAV